MNDDLRAPKPASATTAARNMSVANTLNFADAADFTRASRGLLCQIDPPIITNSHGAVVWDLGQFAFLESDPPAEANPSLWRQAQLNMHHGLFEVVDGIYQVRGYDLSNISFIRTDTGWLVIDPLTSATTAAAARALVDQHFGALPIVAVIYTHSHTDHYGGIRGIVTDAEIASGAVRLIAPTGFLEAAISENVVAGPAMLRRAMYMYGPLLPKGPKGHIDAGLGKTVPLGDIGLIAPTESICATGDTLIIDGVRVEFQMTPGTEAPAEMNFYFPDFRAVCMAENCAATLHNVYTPRGAEIRDALSWSTYINEAIELFLDRSDVAFASHHWPRWGRTDMLAFLAGQRDIYRCLHDETMRLANHGHTPLEIAEEIEIPAAIGDEWFNRDYYGTVNHNVKAVYQRYLGWFDANPANLHPLPPVETAHKIVEYMGGADEILRRARIDFEAGNYRWVAQILNHVVFADPANDAARLLQADTLEQLGYQSESGPWRAFYLMGAQELRNGTPVVPGLRSTASVDVMRAMTPQMVLNNCGVKLNTPRATTHELVFHFTFSDHNETHELVVHNGVFHVNSIAQHTPDATIDTTVESLVRITSATSTVDDELAKGTFKIIGNHGAFDLLIGLLDQFDMFFAIIEP